MEEVVVKWFNLNKGYGFGVTSNDLDVFLHYSAIISDCDSRVNLESGQNILCEIEKGEKDLKATRIMFS